ncbi:hypothetical protein MTR_6g072023 [Medicago truncatula]|uniref:Uncharacterized protein n=1 Tax=Medicago truncatula TaxID=3880 RepID=A0A072UAT2_MEDTR|nr:hypothetical protein MTR_6g072023 [Medicago truncatula]
MLFPSSLSNNALIRGKKLKCIEERYSPRRKLLKTCQGSIYADKGHLVSFLNVSIPTEMANLKNLQTIYPLWKLRQPITRFLEAVYKLQMEEAKIVF